MRIYLFLILTAIEIIQVHSYVRGERVDGDYTLSYRVQTKTAADPSIYLQYPFLNETARPEIITCLDLLYVGLPAFAVVLRSGGVGTTTYDAYFGPGDRTYIMYAYGKPPPESLTSGTMTPQDSLLYLETITKPAVANKVLVINLKFPKIPNPTATITWISVKDEYYNDPKAVKVIQGGNGFKGVNIQMQSRVGQGLRFRVQIFGNNFTADDWPWYVSSNAATDARLFKSYWPFMDDGKRVKKNCGCKTGRLMIARP